ncbi:hypothetical protein AB1L30_26895 [Bremerella sp. JC817]|uniref:hypothetical protein n=1 Tax=Bremerella sp. JC817 TaxID=3231756 RepID=UPI00345A77EB
MLVLLLALSGLMGLVSIGCFIVIVMQMFQHGDATLGIVCLATLLCGLLGFLIAFVMGWINVGKYQANKVMMIWTFCWIGQMAIAVIGNSSGAFGG